MKFKAGQRVKVVGNTSGHGQAIGSVGVVIGGVATYPTLYQIRLDNTKSVILNYYEADLVAEALTKEEMESKLKTVLAEVEDIKMRIQFLVENSLEKFDEAEFKVYKALLVVESSKSRIDKARALAEIIKG